MKGLTVNINAMYSVEALYRKRIADNFYGIYRNRSILHTN